LIVEDDRCGQEFLSAILEINGFQHHAVDDGGKALREMEVWRPDLVLMNIRCSQKNGSSLFQDMKSRPDLERIPVIVIIGTGPISVSPRQADVETIVETGENFSGSVFKVAVREQLGGHTPEGVVEKPVDPPHLARKIRELLS
jgi:CheY-like chemotaxis protein